jgi:hypothetical protein
LTAYPVIGKKKSRDLCEAFIQGCPNGARGNVFYGVDQTNLDQWDFVRTGSSKDIYYIDNSYFDKTRGSHFRITKGAVQHSGEGESDGQRFKALALEIKPWRKTGEHIVVCPQSDSFMRDIAGWKNDWLSEAVRSMALVSHRRFQVRNWDRDKIKAASTLPSDLKNAWILATYSSAASVTALLEGIPVACCAGACYGLGVRVIDVEQPIFPKDRERFFGVLADNQWTVDEMRNGTAWNMLTTRV